jgi:hypothetical protein
MIRVMYSIYAHIKRCRAMVPGLGLAFGAAGAMATLGQAPSVPTPVAASAQVPAAKQLAAKPVTQNALLTVHERQLDNGTLVREYANTAGLVFAVSWRGPVLPNLSELLGGYFSSFMQQVDQARVMGKRGGPVNLESADLVIRSSGRMRSFVGHAYAPALIPPGVTIQDVLQ